MTESATADGASAPGGARGRTGRALAHAAALAPVALAGAIAAGARLDGANLAMAFLAAVLVSAVSFGLGPALTAALAAAVGYDFFFLEPRFTFHIARPADLVTFAVFFLAALATGWLAGRARDEARRATAEARTVAALLAASERLSASASREQAAQVLVERLQDAGVGAAVVLAPAGETMRVIAASGGLSALDDANTSAAQGVWETGEDAPAGDWRFRPLEGAHGRVGVVGLRAAASPAPDADRRLTQALLAEGAAALERAQLAEAAAENAALRRADELRSALLNSISHDFRTPLASVLGAATTLQDFEAELAPAVKRDLLESIGEDARRLNRYVGDLLDMSRLEAGALAPRREWTDVREAINSAIDRAPEGAAQRIARDFAKPLSKVKADQTLLEQAVLNILENALAYSPAEARIEVAAHEDLETVVITIEDEGPGVPREALGAIFERFRRLEQPSDRGRGLGLGLSIAKGFVEAMGGRIAAASPVRDGHGTRFVISLPKSVATPRDLL
ncbi:DUF4118 domain-containing protein [Phenylobacterium sp.]|uniref:DUF4118 domain-containing protein n=1 Tax=Phenylobacterium sp. TaxID=1871053 RepID=UPI0035B271F6